MLLTSLMDERRLVFYRKRRKAMVHSRIRSLMFVSGCILSILVYVTNIKYRINSLRSNK